MLQSFVWFHVWFRQFLVLLYVSVYKSEKNRGSSLFFCCLCETYTDDEYSILQSYDTQYYHQFFHYIYIEYKLYSRGVGTNCWYVVCNFHETLRIVSTIYYIYKLMGCLSVRLRQLKSFHKLLKLFVVCMYVIMLYVLRVTHLLHLALLFASFAFFLLYAIQHYFYAQASVFVLLQSGKRMRFMTFLQLLRFFQNRFEIFSKLVFYLCIKFLDFFKIIFIVYFGKCCCVTSYDFGCCLLA